MRAARLGGHRGPGLFGDQRLLHGGEQVVGLGQSQPHRVGGQRPAFERAHVADHGRVLVVVGFQHDLNGELHAAPPAVTADDSAPAAG